MSEIFKKSVEKYYQYSVYGELKNIGWDENGFFVGNS